MNYLHLIYIANVFFFFLVVHLCFRSGLNVLVLGTGSIPLALNCDSPTRKVGLIELVDLKDPTPLVAYVVIVKGW